MNLRATSTAERLHHHAVSDDLVVEIFEFSFEDDGCIQRLVRAYVPDGSTALLDPESVADVRSVFEIGGDHAANLYVQGRRQLIVAGGFMDDDQTPDAAFGVAELLQLWLATGPGDAAA